MQEQTFLREFTRVLQCRKFMSGVQRNKMEIQKYIDYIQECRKRGFKDEAIRQSLLDKGWPEEEIMDAFYFVNKKAITKEIEEHKEARKQENFGGSVTIYLDEELKQALEKRSKKNMLTLPEQIEDILRRSTLSMRNKKSTTSEKLDDNLVGIFSRKNTGPKSKKKKAKSKKKSAKKDKKSKRKGKGIKKKAERREKRMKKKSKRK